MLGVIVKQAPFSLLKNPGVTPRSTLVLVQFSPKSFHVARAPRRAASTLVSTLETSRRPITLIPHDHPPPPTHLSRRPLDLPNLASPRRPPPIAISTARQGVIRRSLRSNGPKIRQRDNGSAILTPGRDSEPDRKIAAPRRGTWRLRLSRLRHHGKSRSRLDTAQDPRERADEVSKGLHR